MEFDRDNNGCLYAPHIHCHMCGHFIGKDGYCDICHSDEGYEVGYPICGKCFRSTYKNEIKMREMMDGFFP